jgi:uncharacterized protein YjbI with pentapeptide repeats
LGEGAIAEKDRFGNLRVMQHDIGESELPDALLSSANLERAKMSGAMAIQADFTDAIMRNCKLTRANLRSAKLTGANLENADLSGCTLAGADLSSCILVGAQMSSTILDGADMTGALFAAPTADPEGSLIELLNAHSRWAETDGREGKPADFTGMDLRELKSLAHRPLTALIAPGAMLYGLDLEGASLQGSNFAGADLRGASGQCGFARRQLIRRETQQRLSARRASRPAAHFRTAPAAGPSRWRRRALCRFSRRRHAPRQAEKSGSVLFQSHRCGFARLRAGRRDPRRRKTADDARRRFFLHNTAKGVA